MWWWIDMIFPPIKREWVWHLHQSDLPVHPRGPGIITDKKRLPPEIENDNLWLICVLGDKSWRYTTLFWSSDQIFPMFGLKYCENMKYNILRPCVPETIRVEETQHLCSGRLIWYSQCLTYNIMIFSKYWDRKYDIPGPCVPQMIRVEKTHHGSVLVVWPDIPVQCLFVWTRHDKQCREGVPYKWYTPTATHKWKCHIYIFVIIIHNSLALSDLVTQTVSDRISTQYSGVSLCITVYHCLPLCITLCHCMSQCVTVYFCVSLGITKCHCVSLCVIVCH